MKRTLKALGPSLLAIAFTFSCKSGAPEKPTPEPRAKTLRFLLSADEHGWMAPLKDKARGQYLGGAKNFAAHIKKDGAGQKNVALLSAGDNWTGPFESTLLQGAPMVALMNAMGYRASAIGNHEFDFDISILKARASEAQFEFLAANIETLNEGIAPDFAKPSTLFELDGHQVGVIGLSTTETPVTTDPTHIAHLKFTQYEQALRRESKALKLKGATTLVVIMHEGLDAAKPLAPILRELDIKVVALGHNHEEVVFVDEGDVNRKDDDVLFCNGGPYWRSYCKVDLTFNAEGPAREVQASLQYVTRDIESPEVESVLLQPILDEAKLQAAGKGDEVLTRAPKGISQRRDVLGKMITDAWLAHFPSAQVAITNRGGIRQSIEAGDVRVRDIVSALPFSNYLIIVDISGKELKQALAKKSSVFSGVKARFRGRGKRRRVTRLKLLDGSKVSDEQRVRVVINSFMYVGGDGYAFNEWTKGQDVRETGLDWREPIFQALRSTEQYPPRGN